MKAYPYMHKHPTSGQTTESGGMDLTRLLRCESCHASPCNARQRTYAFSEEHVQDVRLSSAYAMLTQ
jgi:hypothetical protein